MSDKERQFTQLVSEYKRTIYTVCYMFSKDAAEIEDLFQEILVRMWNGFGSFRGDCDVRSHHRWLYRTPYA